MGKTVSGWTDEMRREEMERLILVAQTRFGWDRPQTLVAISNRFSVSVNTIQGWISKPGKDGTATKRSPPVWHVIELLRIQLGEAPIVGLDEFYPADRAKPTSKVLLVQENRPPPQTEPQRSELSGVHPGRLSRAR